MKKLLPVFIVFAFLSSGITTLFAAGEFRSGLSSAAKNEIISRLVKAAKESDPNSTLPATLEKMLTGLSVLTDPTATLEAIYPGSLALSAISQLIDKHWPNISRMSYSDRKVWVDGGDDSMIPEDDTEKKPDPIVELCRSMLKYDDARLCVSKMRRVHECNVLKDKKDKTSKALFKKLKEGCNEDILAIYELMEWDGKNDFIKEAGRIGGIGYKEGMQYFATKEGITESTAENITEQTTENEKKCEPIYNQKIDADLTAAFEKGDVPEMERLLEIRKQITQECQ